MQGIRSFRNRFLAVAAGGLLLAASPLPAHAASREIIEMQAQIQQLLDNVQRLQSTVDKGFAVMQSLAQQTADNANQVTAAVGALQKGIAAQNDSVNGKLDANSGQIQSLNDSVDELKTRIAKLDKSIQDLQSQLQNAQAPPSAETPAAEAMPTAEAPAAATGETPGEVPTGAPGSDAPSPNPTPAGTAAGQKPPLEDTFQSAVRDYDAARYGVATGEFQDVIQSYPLDELAGSAQYYLGEIAYRQHKYEDAVKSYSAVLEGFPGNSKAPAAQLHKGISLMKLGKKEAGIRQLRLLIQHHPQTPEAEQARAQLSAMGVKHTAH